MPKPDPSKTKLTGIRPPVIQKPNQQQFLPFPSPTEVFPQSDQQNQVDWDSVCRSVLIYLIQIAFMIGFFR
jgi:hypothetical protein